MSGVFTQGQEMVRPGIYSRLTTGKNNAGVNKTGIIAAVIMATWGPLNSPQPITGNTQAQAIFGTGGTTALIKRLLKKAKKTFVVRAGTGGSQGSITLQDTAGSPADVITLTLKYVGTRAISITIQDDLIDTTKRDVIIYEGAVELERFFFAKGSAEIDGLIAAVAGSAYFTPAKVAAGNGTLAAITQSPFTGGADPTASTTEYSAAMNALQGVSFSLLVLDTNTTAIHAVAAAYVARVFSEGKRVHLVLGEPKSVALATRLAHAAAFNSKLIIYVVGGGIEADDTTAEGYLAAADVAGLIASTPNSKAITHQPIDSYLQLAESFTNTQIMQALQMGAVIITAADDGTVRVEQGITTLVTPASNEDDGWKKIRRARARFELLDRVDAEGDPLLGQINNDSTGRGEFVMKARNVISDMISEGKVARGTDIEEDPANPAEGDSAWWAIGVVDQDNVEKIYLTYTTNFAAAI